MILAYPLVSSDAVFTGHPSCSEDLLSLLDAWLDILQIRKRWTSSVDIRPQVQIMDTLVNLIHRHGLLPDANPVLMEKAYVLLVLCCSDLAAQPGVLLDTSPEGSEGRDSYCRALITLASILSRYETAKRVLATKLIHDLVALCQDSGQRDTKAQAVTAQGAPVLGRGTDVWASAFLVVKL